MTNQEQLGVTIIRVACAVTIMIHGVARIALGEVLPFGEFLSMNHIPFGGVVAWVVTFAEIGGGIALVAGYFVGPLCLGFAMQSLAGIVLVHFREGWFVVGAGRNGMEFSVLLIACFIATSLFHTRDVDPGKEP